MGNNPEMQNTGYFNQCSLAYNQKLKILASHEEIAKSLSSVNIYYVISI
jgi:hypothetical protein